LDKTLVDRLLAQILVAFDSGCRSFAILGVNQVSMRVLAAVDDLGLSSLGDWLLIDIQEGRSSAADLPPHVVRLKDVASLRIEVLVIPFDREKEDILRKFAEVDSRLPRVILAGSEHFNLHDPAFDTIRRACLPRSYATGYELSLLHLYQAIEYLSRIDAEGSVVEFGIFKAGTATFIAKAFEHFGRSDVPIIGFDAFSGFPPRRSLFDLYTNPDCEFEDAEAVADFGRRYNITVVEGDICETYRRLDGVPLLLTFFDTDNYSPTAAALELCYEQTVPGGVIAFDHYHSTEQFVYTIGERMAAREFFAEKPTFHLHGTGVFVKL
jgi:O-methyltransferase